MATMTRLRQLRCVVIINPYIYCGKQTLANYYFIFLIKDLSWLIERLGSLKAAIRVDSPGFTHGDFIWSTRLAELVNLPVIDLIPSNFH
jgi:hypothetical protein